MSQRRDDLMGGPPSGGPLPDEAADSFEEFYRREFPRMVTLACAVSGSRIAAEDIAQDALLTAQTRWSTLSSYELPSAWLRRVTIQLASKRLRRARSEAAALLRLGARDPIPPGTDEVEQVLRAIGQLPRRQRAAITLCYLEERSVREIAEILGCAEGTVKAHLHKARTSLGRLLAEGEAR